MHDEMVYLDLTPKAFHSLEELSLIQGQSLSAALADAISESLLRERLAYGCFCSTLRDYEGLTPDGSIRLLPVRESA